MPPLRLTHHMRRNTTLRLTRWLRDHPVLQAESLLLVAMLIELSLTITLVWLAYAGFLLNTRRRKPR